jgi:S1-C subfamily serine protease
MKSAKTWCSAIALLCLAGAIMPPVGRAQSAPEQPAQDPAPAPPQPPTRIPNGDRDGRLWSQQGAAGEMKRWFYPARDAQQFQWQMLSAQDVGKLFPGSGSRSDLNLAAADASLREHLNLPENQGLVVIAVDPTSSAARAGIQQNDVLLSLGDSPLSQPKDLHEQLRKAGEKPVALVLMRAGSRITLNVQPLVRVTLGPAVVTSPPREYWIGISVTPLEPVLRAQLHLSNPHVVIVNQVVAQSPAAKAGVVLHDIIVAVDGKPILDPADLAKMVQAKAGKEIVLELIGKGGKPRTVSVTPARKKPTETSQANPASDPSVATYNFVRPAAVIVDEPVNYPSVNYVVDHPYRFDVTTAVPTSANVGQKPANAGIDLNKRLDTLDSDLNELRKLVEELQKTATRIVERQKGTGDSPKD